MFINPPVIVRAEGSQIWRLNPGLALNTNVTECFFFGLLWCFTRYEPTEHAGSEKREQLFDCSTVRLHYFTVQLGDRIWMRCWTLRKLPVHVCSVQNRAADVDQVWTVPSLSRWSCGWLVLLDVTGTS